MVTMTRIVVRGRLAMMLTILLLMSTKILPIGTMMRLITV